MSLGTDLATHLPFLRRHSRQLTGSQTAGDVLVRATLDDIVANPDTFPRELGARLGLYRAFKTATTRFDSTDWSALAEADRYLNPFLNNRLLSLPLTTRRAFLLAVSEGFTYSEVSIIMNIDVDDVDALIKAGLEVAGAETLSSLMANSADQFLQPVKSTEGTSDEQLLSLVPVSNAPQARAIDGKVRLAERPVELPKAALGRLELLRSDHLAEALATQGEIGNLGGGFDRRLASIVRLLSDPMTNDSSLRLANQVHAIASMKPIIIEELTASTAAGLVAFIDQLVLYCGKFPSWQAFNASEDTIFDSSEISTLATTIQSEGSEVVGTDVQDALSEAIELGGDAATLERAYRDGFVHNVLSEAGRYLIARAKGASKGFNEKIEKEIGEGLAVGLSNLIIAASTPLLALAIQLPTHWAWAGPALAAARVIVGRK